MPLLLQLFYIFFNTMKYNRTISILQLAITLKIIFLINLSISTLTINTTLNKK